MCISHYLNLGSKQYIDALERYKQNVNSIIKAFKPSSDVIIALSQSIKHIDKIIQDRKANEEHGREIINRVADPEARQLLTLYYCERKSWEEVGEMMYISEHTVFNKRKKALELFDQSEADFNACFGVASDSLTFDTP